MTPLDPNRTRGTRTAGDPEGGDALFADVEWLRRLARGLVGDPAAADDLAQDAWVVALQSGGHVESRRGWLAGVLRNLALRRGASEGARSRREARVAAEGGAGLPGTDELVERAELARRLMEEVTALEEPLRTVVLLRYVEGVSPERIAARRGVPASTVRTQLQRGLERLRTRLDRSNGGRAGWMAGVVALAQPPAATGTLAVGVSAGTTLGITMTKKGLLGVGLAAMVGLGIWQPWRGSSPSGDPAAAAASSHLGTQAPASDEQDADSPRPVAEDERTRMANEPAPTTLREPRPGLLFGRITDDVGAPLERARVELVLDAGNGGQRTALADHDGVFTIPELDPGTWELAASAPACESVQRTVEFTGLEDAHRLDLQLARGVSVLVRLTDSEGEPYQGSEMDAVMGRTPLALATLGPPPAVLKGVNGMAPSGVGNFRTSLRAGEVPEGAVGVLGVLELPRTQGVVVSLVRRAAVVRSQALVPGATEIHFEVDAEELEATNGGVSVRFVDAASGAPLATGRASLNHHSVYSFGQPLEEGRFEETGVAPGAWCLTLQAEGFARLERWVEVEPGVSLELGDVPVTQSTRLQGTVQDAGGAVSDGGIRAFEAGVTYGPLDAHWSMITPTDEAGAFALDVPDTHVVLVLREPGGRFSAWPVHGGGADVDIAIAGGGVLVVDGSELERAVRATVYSPEGVPLVARTVEPAGRWRQALVDGTYELRFDEQQRDLGARTVRIDGDEVTIAAPGGGR